MNLAIHEAFLSGKHTVDGVRLAPYSAAHAFTLEAIGWKVADMAETAGLVRFLAVCSQPVGEGCAVVPKVGARLTLCHLLWRLFPGTRAAAILAVVEYLRDFTSTPRIDAPEGGKTLSGSDLVFRVTKAMRLGISEHRAWSMPIGALNCYLAHAQALEDAEEGRSGPVMADPDFENFVEEQFRLIREREKAKEAAHG